jgi:heme ABC exporter ATP-binding subunit CcmA
MRSAVCLSDRFPALAGADLDVEQGEIVLVTGPNGAGKTTLLRLVAGLARLHSGMLTVLGHDLARDPRAARRGISLVGHATGCYDDLTVEENVRFAARAAGRSDAGVDAALERFGLGRVARVAHGRLSAGQRRRVSLAVATVREPELLLLDEPHAGLDHEGRAALDALLGVSAGAVRTVIIASHEVERARRFATREVVASNGRLAGGVVAEDRSPRARAEVPT